MLVVACVWGGGPSSSTGSLSQPSDPFTESSDPMVVTVPQTVGECGLVGVPSSLKVGEAADLVVAESGWAWVADWTTGLITQVSLPDLCVVRTLSVGEPSAGVNDMVPTQDSVWVSDFADGSLREISAATGDTLSVISDVRAGSGMAVTGVGLVVACCGFGEGSGPEPIVRISLPDMSLDVLAMLDWPSAMAFGHGYLWIGSYVTPVLYRVDPASGDVTSVELSGVVRDVAVGPGEIWVLRAGAVVRVDPDTLAVADAIVLPDPAHQPTVIEADPEGNVWTAGNGTSPSKYDPGSGKRLVRVNVPSRGMAITKDALLVTTNSGLLVAVPIAEQ